jgi:hypothetical protein
VPQLYTQGSGVDLVDPLVSPSSAEPSLLSRFPQTRIMAAEHDVLFGGALASGRHLRRARSSGNGSAGR